ncbi:MAG: DoxX family protein [Pseudomonadota bacterium]
MTMTTAYAGKALGLLRIVSALLFIEHGTSKLVGFPPFTTGALPALGTLPWIGGVIELVGGLLVLLGFLSRPAAFILSGEMAVAYWMFHAPKSTFPINNGGDAAILFCFVFLYIAAAGAGDWSVDENLAGKRKA